MTEWVCLKTQIRPNRVGYLPYVPLGAQTGPDDVKASTPHHTPPPPSRQSYRAPHSLEVFAFCDVAQKHVYAVTFIYNLLLLYAGFWL